MRRRFTDEGATDRGINGVFDALGREDDERILFPEGFQPLLDAGGENGIFQ